jgi:beta-mannanase
VTSDRAAWAVVVGLGVLGVLLLVSTVATLAVAVVAGLIGYVLLAAPLQPQPAAAGGAAGVAGVALPPGAHALPTAPDEIRRPTLGISTETVADLDSFITTTGTVPDVWDEFQAWSTNEPLDVRLADDVVSRGVHLSVTWMPWDPSASPGNHAVQPRYSLASIIDGSHDAYIDAFARSVAKVPDTVTIRLMHEMNGNWYPWGSGVNGNQPGQFVAAWKHVHDRFARLGVSNVSWMWAPNAVYTGGAALTALFPGDAYVDEVGLSNYNWGNFTHDDFSTRWAAFGALFDASIAQLQVMSSRPIWIAEVGSTHQGGSQAAWLSASLAEVARRPEIAGLVYFDHVDAKAGVDWRIDRDPASVRAWVDAFLTRPVVRVDDGPGRGAD